MRLTDELRVEIEEEIEAAVGLGFVDLSRHDEIGRVVVAFALDEAGVEIGEAGIKVAHSFGEDLEFLATPAFD